MRAEEAARRCRHQGRVDDRRSRSPRSGPRRAPARARSATTGSSTFRDDQLTAAVAEAIAHNADLQRRRRARRAGAAAMRSSPAPSCIRRSTCWRAAAASCRATAPGCRAASSRVSWELDLWGRVRYGRAAAAADARVGAGRFRVRAPVDRGAGGEELVPGDRGRACRRRWRARADSRQRGAGPSRRRPRQASASATTKTCTSRGPRSGPIATRCARLELAREQALRALELLIGRYPVGGDRRERRSCPASPTPSRSGLPSELLERRPDVIAAERRVAAAFNRVARSQGRAPAGDLADRRRQRDFERPVRAKDRENPVWSAGASLLAPIFRGGALKTQVEIRTAEQKQAVAAYADVGLRAFGEVESALVGRDRGARSRADSRRRPSPTTSARSRSCRPSSRSGSTDLRFVTQRQLALNATQSALVRVQAEQRVQRVNLHLALGGSFEPRPAQ